MLSVKSSSLWYRKSLLSHWVTSLARAQLRNGSYATDICYTGSCSTDGSDSKCRYRGYEFVPSPIPYFCGD